MKNLFIVTAGTSLLENLEKKVGELQTQQKAAALPGKLPPDFTRLYDPPNSRWADDLHWICCYYSQRYRRDALRETTTAELASLSLLSEEASPIRLRPEAELCFLTSSTSTGVFCALVNAYLLVGEEGTVRIWDADNYRPGQTVNWSLPALPTNPDLDKWTRPRQATILPVPHVDPTKPKDFAEKGIAEFFTSLSHLIIQAQNVKQQPVVNFTAGMKAVVPLLTIAAGWLGGIPLVGLHEEADALLHIATPKLDPDGEWEKAIRKFSAGELVADGKNKPFSDSVQRLFVNEGQLQLSPLGQVLRSILYATERL